MTKKIRQLDRLSNKYATIAASNRAKFPEVAEFVDEARKIWPGAKIKYVGPRRRSLYSSGKHNKEGCF